MKTNKLSLTINLFFRITLINQICKIHLHGKYILSGEYYTVFQWKIMQTNLLKVSALHWEEGEGYLISEMGINFMRDKSPIVNVLIW
jgi:hypothetical protein